MKRFSTSEVKGQGHSELRDQMHSCGGGLHLDGVAWRLACFHFRYFRGEIFNKKLVQLENVAIANALQVEVARATPALSRFNYDAMPSLMSPNLSIAVL